MWCDEGAEEELVIVVQCICIGCLAVTDILIEGCQLDLDVLKKCSEINYFLLYGIETLMVSNHLKHYNEEKYFVLIILYYYY